MFDIGNTLREARLRRGYDLARCEAGTKIRGKYLRAMEEEQFDVLPAPTYVRGFLRSYADFLGLDWQLLLDEYESRFGGFSDPSSESDGPAPPRRRHRGTSASERRSPEARLLWLAMGGVLSVALLVWLGVGGPSEDQAALPAQPPASSPPATTSRVQSELRLRGVGSGTGFAVRRTNARGTVLDVGRLDSGAAKSYRFRGSIWMDIRDPAGVKVTVAGVERRVPAAGGYLVTLSGLQPSGGSGRGG
jgi:cytoskeletal protein RodZ